MSATDPAAIKGAPHATPGGVRDIARCLAEEAALLQRFVDVLREEQKTLAEGECDIAHLMTLVTEKTRHASQLAQWAEQRSALLVAAGCTPDRAGMQQWLDHVSAAAASRKLWLAMLALADEARALNETNGHLIGIRLQHNQQALSVLLTAANQAALYGPDGQTHAAPGGRLFGSA